MRLAMIRTATGRSAVRIDADLARWLTGRGATNIHTSDDSALPTLRPWL